MASMQQAAMLALWTHRLMFLEHGLQDRAVPLGQACFCGGKPMFLFCPLISRCWCVSEVPGDFSAQTANPFFPT